MLLTLRCVQAKDKAMAMGLIQFAIGLFGKNLNVKSFSAFVMSNRVVSLDS